MTFDGAGWKTVVNRDLGFSLQYPSTWKPQESVWTVLAGSEGLGRQTEIAVMTSTNITIDSSWPRARLSNGILATYRVDDGYVHLYDVRGGRLVILSAPANAPEALEILSTYQPIGAE